MFKTLGIVAVIVISIPFSNSQNRIKVAIIGGGMSGISAASGIYKLDSTAEITLFEKEGLLGGNARTIPIKSHSGEMLHIDAGPQYFAEGPWDNYIQFLKDFQLYNENELSSFKGSFIVESELQPKPNYVSPANGGLRGGKLSHSIQFLKFYNSAHRICSGKTTEYPKHIGAWVETLKLKDSYRNKVVYPFLASSLGTSIEDIKRTDTKEIVSLFAFRKALKKGEFIVSNIGMGSLINRVGNELKTKGINILTGSPVISVKIEKNKVFISTDDAMNAFDFVVFAIHPYQAAKLLNDLPELSNQLKEFEYFKAHIVIHTDSTFVNSKRVSFLNIKTNSANTEVISNTMNLGVINPMFTGYFKSWLQEEDVELVKSNGTFVHEEIFNHPMITPEFKLDLIKLKAIEKNYSNIYFAGGWSEGLETQETAIISGMNASLKYQAFKNSQH